LHRQIGNKKSECTFSTRHYYCNRRSKNRQTAPKHFNLSFANARVLAYQFDFSDKYSLRGSCYCLTASHSSLQVFQPRPEQRGKNAITKLRKTSSASESTRTAKQLRRSSRILTIPCDVRAVLPSVGRLQSEQKQKRRVYLFVSLATGSTYHETLIKRDAYKWFPESSSTTRNTVNGSNHIAHPLLSY